MIRPTLSDITYPNVNLLPCTSKEYKLFEYFLLWNKTVALPFPFPSPKFEIQSGCFRTLVDT